jgi:hypothetical protein
MKEYITMQGKCHPDARLVIMQHDDEKRHGYAKGPSF